ncbi:ATP-binding cassette domain-containing protein [Betaproteobacteria bacterium LSUCC0115]|nr:ATP-binding cassette domain-containing protein [Burkholderiales bacterium LSUCC0115]
MIFEKIKKIFVSNKSLVRVIYLQTIVVGLFSLAPIIYMRDVYGPIISAESIHNLFYATFALLVALVCQSLVSVLRRRTLFAASVILEQAVLSDVLRLSYQYASETGRLISTPLNDFQAVKKFLSSQPMMALLDLPMSILFIVIVFFIHPFMGWITLLGVVLTALVSFTTERKVAPLMKQVYADMSKNGQFLSDLYYCAKEIRPNVPFETLAARSERDQSNSQSLLLRASDVQASGITLVKFVSTVQGSVMLGLGAALMIASVLHPALGAYLIIAKILGGFASRPIIQLLSSWKSLNDTYEAISRLRTFDEYSIEQKFQKGLPKPDGLLTFQNVNLVRNNVRILTNISLTVKKGQLLTVVGPPGSGKSTLLKLATGLLAPTSGEVQLSSIRASKWDPNESCHYIGYVSQNPTIFDGNVLQNIARFSEVNDTRISYLVKKLNLDRIIGKLENGIHTALSPEVPILSIGEQQKLCIARALYTSPRYLILDEPDSALDSQNKKILIDLIVELMREGETTILVASHSSDFIRISEWLMVLQGGSILGYGRTPAVIQKLQEDGKK